MSRPPDPSPVQASPQKTEGPISTTEKISVREGGDSVEAVTSRTAATNESQSNHSPLPWVQGPNFPEQIFDADGLRVADCGLRDPEDASDAAFIVRAVNCHDELLAACVESYDWIAAHVGNLPASAVKLSTVLRAAIAKAERP
jgi:hypothetical protein